MKRLLIILALIIPLQGCVELIVLSPYLFEVGLQGVIEGTTNTVHGGPYARCIKKYEGAELDRCLAKHQKS